MQKQRPITLDTCSLGGNLDIGNGVYAWCYECGRASELDLAGLVDRFGREKPVREVKARCRDCGLVDRIWIRWPTDRMSAEAAVRRPSPVRRPETSPLKGI